MKRKEDKMERWIRTGKLHGFRFMVVVHDDFNGMEYPYYARSGELKGVFDRFHRKNNQRITSIHMLKGLKG